MKPADTIEHMRKDRWPHLAHRYFDPQCEEEVFIFRCSGREVRTEVGAQVLWSDGCDWFERLDRCEWLVTHPDVCAVRSRKRVMMRPRWMGRGARFGQTREKGAV